MVGHNDIRVGVVVGLRAYMMASGQDSSRGHAHAAIRREGLKAWA